MLRQRKPCLRRFRMLAALLRTRRSYRIWIGQENTCLTNKECLQRSINSYFNSQYRRAQSSRKIKTRNQISHRVALWWAAIKEIIFCVADNRPQMEDHRITFWRAIIISLPPHKLPPHLCRLVILHHQVRRATTVPHWSSLIRKGGLSLNLIWKWCLKCRKRRGKKRAHRPLEIRMKPWRLWPSFSNNGRPINKKRLT